MHEQSFSNVTNNSTYMVVSRSKQKQQKISENHSSLQDDPCMIPWHNICLHNYQSTSSIQLIDYKLESFSDKIHFGKTVTTLIFITIQLKLTRWTFRWFFRRENSRFRLDKGGLTNILTAKRYSIMSYWCLIRYDNKYNSSVKWWF